MQEKIDYFTRKMNENVYQPKKSFSPQKKGVPYTTFFIVVITIVVFMFIFFQKYDSIKNLFGSGDSSLSEVLENDYKIGQKLSLSGTIFSDGDLVSYSHSIHTYDGSVFGLKSRSLNLSDYKGDIIIRGYIEKLVGDIFVVEVDYISGELLLENTGTLSTGKYISDAGIFFDSDFFENYSLENYGDGEIVARDINSNAKITISYFKCNTYNPDKNCRILNDTFSKSSEKDFTTSNGVSFYKLEFVDSWYFANDTLIGYFINGSPQADVMKISDYIILLNQTYVKDNIIPNVSNICSKGLIKIEKTDSYEVKLEDNNLVSIIKGTLNTGNVTCKIVIDPLSMWKANLKDINMDTIKNNLQSNSNSLQWDPNVKQFPINLEKTTEFVSATRGYKIIFPSRNISFASTNVQADFGQLGVNCFTQMNVVSYPNKENLQTNPSIKIYECNIKGGFQESNNLILKKILDRNFVIEILDPSWIEFTNNVSIQ